MLKGGRRRRLPDPYRQERDEPYGSTISHSQGKSTRLCKIFLFSGGSSIGTNRAAQKMPGKSPTSDVSGRLVEEKVVPTSFRGAVT
jgi:hypothetical protein